MRIHFPALVSAFIASQASAVGCEIVWPDAATPIPPQVHSFILSECNSYKGTTEESIDECIEAEAYGYRAIINMLTDASTGEKAAERYRACAAGLGDFGGRFHRRKAECVGGSLGLIWRFEFTARI